MRKSTNIGVISAIMLISTLIMGTFGTVFQQVTFFKYLTAACAVVGLLMVIWSAVVVLRESLSLQQAINSELSDVPDLVQQASFPRGGTPAQPR